MAENNEKIPEASVAKEKKADKKPNIFARIGRRIKKFFKDYFSEMKKVVWPSRKQVVKNTLIVMAVVLIIGVFIWALDLLFQFGLFQFFK